MYYICTFINPGFFVVSKMAVFIEEEKHYENYELNKGIFEIYA